MGHSRRFCLAPCGRCRRLGSTAGHTGPFVDALRLTRRHVLPLLLECPGKRHRVRFATEEAEPAIWAKRRAQHIGYPFRAGSPTV